MQAQDVERPSFSASASSHEKLRARIALGLPGLALVLAVIFCYPAAWFAGFIWDDNFHLTANPCIVGPQGLGAIWSTGAWSFCPLVLVTFWAEHQVWGLWPLPYHLVNVALHAASAVLLWRILRCLGVPGAWWGAVLWGLHPVQVETVAWVSEMKNTLSGVFYLLAILFFAKGLMSNEPSDVRSRRWNRALVVVFAALAMTAKASTVILPAELALMAWWVEGRWNWRRHAGVLAPVVLMAVVAGVVTVVLPGPSAPLGSNWVQPWPERLVTAGDAVWFYLGKLLWPYPLAAVYPHWTLHAQEFIAWQYFLTDLALLGLLLLNRAPAWRAVLFAYGYFLIALLPTLGLVSLAYGRFSPVADHFQYLASMGPLALGGAALDRLVRAAGPGQVWALRLACAAVVLVLAALTWMRSWVFLDQETLWADTLAKNPGCAVAYNNLGDVMVRAGRLGSATSDLRKAVALDPDYPEAHNNLGIALARAGHLDEAIAEYRKALALDPAFASACDNLGVALARRGQIDEAVGMFRQAVRMNPYDANAHFNLGNMALRRGRLDEAMAEFGKALEIDPGNFKARHNLDAVLQQKQDIAQGSLTPAQMPSEPRMP